MAGDTDPGGLGRDEQQEQAKTVNADPIKVAEHSAGAELCVPVNNEVIISPIIPTLRAHSLAGESNCGRPPIAEFVDRDSTRSNLALSS